VLRCLSRAGALTGTVSAAFFYSGHLTSTPTHGTSDKLPKKEYINNKSGDLGGQGVNVVCIQWGITIRHSSFLYF
jgi:hypothetical protein